MDTRLAGAALGAVTGIRSTAGLTAIARGGKARFARGSLLLAAGEAIADKAIDLPARTEFAPLAARGILGAVAAGAFARKQGGGVVESAVVGAAAALATAWAATTLRRFMTKNYDVPDAAIGLAEDALVLAASAWVLRDGGR